ncbi:MAG: hypothetical protein WBA48_18765 [Xanthobacteraceae bacterium]
MLEHVPDHFEANLQKPYAFETRWRVASPPLRTAIDNFIDFLLSKEPPRRRARKNHDLEKFKRAAEVICCNLLAITLAPESSRPLAVIRGHSASATSSIYGKHFNQALDLMESLGIITYERGGKFIRKDIRAPSTIMATAKIAEHLPSIEDWSSLRLEEPESVIVLKDGHGEVELDPQWFERVKDEMSCINTMVQSERVTFNGNVVSEKDTDSHPAVLLRTPHHRSMRRIFNGDYQSGGRLYDGFWETMPKENRSRIHIDGQPIAVVDYGQMHLRLAYAKAGKQPPPGDLYDFTGEDHLRDDWSALRVARKQLVSALITAKGPLRQWPGSPRERQQIRAAFPAGIKPRHAMNVIKQHHHAVAAEWFENGRNLMLHRIESDILVTVLWRLAKLNIIALPIHDSVIVRHDLAEIAQRIMEEEADGIPAKIERPQDSQRESPARFLLKRVPECRRAKRLSVSP